MLAALAKRTDAPLCAAHSQPVTTHSPTHELANSWRMPCRQRFVSILKAVCLSFGESFAAAVVAPRLQAAAGIPDWRGLASEDAGSWGGPALQSRLASDLAGEPTAPALHDGASAVDALRLLLAGVLPYAGSTAAAQCLRRLCVTDGSTTMAWALQHPR